LAREFISKGFKAIVSCADSETGCGRFAGRDYDENLLSELPEGTDPCFENGECHSFVYNGPISEWPVKFIKGEVVLRDERYYYCDLLPDPAAYFLASERLLFRRFVPSDLDDLHAILSDPDVMKYYPSVLSKEQSKEWLDRILGDYEKYGFSWWAVHLKDSGEYIGQVGIVRREIEGQTRYLLGYMLSKAFWGKGYATEASRKSIDYALEKLGVDHVDVYIRPVNLPSQKVAKRLGLRHEGRIDYYSYEHDIYVAD
jgi:RimJ/RimL family protein N-acetyltransferase